MFLPKIYPITNRRLAKSSHTEQTKQLIEAGAKIVQLREKDLLSAAFYQDAKAAVEFARAHKARIIINDRADIALAVGADGVHLGQDDLSPQNAREILGDKAIIGYSTHSVNQAIEAINMPIDYIAIGPVFPTSTKENPEDAVGLKGVNSVRSEIGDFALAAIGGIDFENCQAVLDSGADSVAMISGLLSTPDTLKQTFKKFNDLTL